MATIKDVAAAAGVSVATVSRVINNGPKVGEQTRERVKAVMAKLDYRPNANARALVTQRNPTLGLVIGEISDPFFASLANGVAQICRESKVQLLISTSLVNAESEQQAIETLLEQRCQSMVVHAKSLSNETLLAYAARESGMVFINRCLPELTKRCVWLDNYAGGQIAARHLLSLGHRQIAFINSNYEIEDPRQRLNGALNVLLEAGLSPQSLIIETASPNEQGGEQAAQNLLAQGALPTAIMTYNDAMAAGVIAVLRDNQVQVPEAISVIGFDDVLLSRYLRPKLTTMRYPIEIMAAAAAKIALSAAGGPPYTASSHLYKPTLVKRHSVTSVV